MFKIIETDAYARETVADRYVASVREEAIAYTICTLLNEDGCGGDSWYVVKPHDYVLWRGMEEFV